MAAAEFIPILLKGAIVSLLIAGAASLVAVVMAFIAGFAKLSGLRAVRWTAACYVEFFRGTSLLVQLFWLFYVLPHFGILLPPYAVAIAALGLNMGAYGSEVVRGAIISVPRAQIEATIALNMTKRLAMRRIVLPQALLTMLLPWGNLLIILFKSTSIVSLITIHDLAFNAYNLNIQTFATVPIYVSTLIIYFIVVQAIAFSVAALYRVVNRGGGGKLA
ncbi:ectoine/hydroxyectoine ABC transporter permease subunit EhuC [Bradyrhizobium sp. 131]|uniref:ectoine/hydroxyectoine ABC transporter permease subunit EhuC n=1 Tax=Bradyrhizobium sp. 131 TaxID=2782609 RepID=UPI001FFF63D8|nr:ectoine/hydroxyectoine ABC transporter permease subunit EhuC [Bradyrhizobium sp. 131]UPK20569.1 ectoine/hydroxyectoine ABC transporter permease subunit EhuC [Bradyrhizobium sp. 131]